MLTILKSFTTHMLDSVLVKVEADIYAKAESKTNIVGLPDTTVRESGERVRSAIRNSGFKYPRGRITCNLAPASLKKSGSGFDLPVALGILACADEELTSYDIKDNMAFIGELSLDGMINPVRGIVSVAISAMNNGVDILFVPAGNSKEASLLSNERLNIFPVRNFADLINHLRGKNLITPERKINIDEIINDEINKSKFCMSHIKGQQHAKRALEIAVTGGHNVLMNGPPGSGKTMLARAMSTILPSMTRNEILETTKIHSIAGLLNDEKPIVATRPFRSPHHTASAVSLIGGSNTLRPGEISLAHNGILFLDELPEFPTIVLETLRQPLEDGFVTVTRANGSVVFPTKFILVAAKNPCPCGYFGDKEKSCTCNPNLISKYRSKISGPLLDRIDIQINVPRVAVEKLANIENGETSEEIRKRVVDARNIQYARGVLNAYITVKDIDKFCIMNDEARKLLLNAVEKMNLSTRAYTRIVRLSRTIADLNKEEVITKNHIAEALSYRG